MASGMMTAAILNQISSPMRIERIPVPQPRAGEALVRVHACGVCHTDLHVIKGEVAFPTPAVLGHEISGTIEALGPGTNGPVKGTRIVAPFIMPCGTCTLCEAGRDDLCEKFFGMNRLKGTLYDGTTRLHRDDGSPVAMYSMAGLAEYSVVPVAGLFPLPESLPAVESAVLGCAVFTAYGAARHAAELRGGERVAVVACGGVGLNVIQIARAFGAAQIVAIDVRDEKLQIAKELGATDTVNAHGASPADVTKTVFELTKGRGVEVAFEVLGRPETFAQAVDLLGDGGRMIAVGIAAGRTTAPVEITRLVRRGLRIIGSYGARTRADMPEIIRLAERGTFRLETFVTRRYPLEEAEAAYQALSRGEIAGRAVVVP
jgi:S-(hydroxymethyl)glutathione dehydrogenase/alcohol dehydrogenase